VLIGSISGGNTTIVTKIDNKMAKDEKLVNFCTP
jgi:hypothetical protein